MFVRDGSGRNTVTVRKRLGHHLHHPHHPQSPLHSPLNSPSQSPSPLQPPSPLQAASPLHIHHSPLHVSSPASTMAPSPHQLSSPHHHHSYLIKHEPSSPNGSTTHESGATNLMMLSPNPSPSMSISSEQSSTYIPNSPSSAHHHSAHHYSVYNSSSSPSTSEMSHHHHSHHTTVITNGFGPKRLRTATMNGGGVSAPRIDQGGGAIILGASSASDWPINSPSAGSLGSLSPTHHSLVMSPASTTSTGTCSPSPRPGQDEVSSPNSVMSPYDAQLACLDRQRDPKKHKKGPVPRQNEELCHVCGDRASGYHYNALTCEGCKGFFRRSITKKAVYTCKYGTNCEIDMYMRRKCQECRFKKCIAVGMREECVVPEGTCQRKRDEKKRKDREKMKIPGGGSPGADSSSSQLMSPGSVYESNEAACMQPNIDKFPLTSDQAEIINKLLYNQELFEVPTPENHKGIGCTSKFHPSNDRGYEDMDNKNMRFSHITEMTIVTVQLIVEFAKRVPGFDTLMQNDQITLLKACTSEVIMLRAARRYDVKTDSIVFSNNYPYKREAYNMAGMVPAITDCLFSFCAKMAEMKVDNAEYALITAICIYSERPNVIEPEKVEKLQDIFVEALRDYTNHKHNRPSGSKFAKLLGILTELRTLGFLNNKQCYTIKKDNCFPDFLMELWDLRKDKDEKDDES